jgi:hypothetical protein
MCERKVRQNGFTNPAKVQQTAISKNLTISGTSSYGTTSNCGLFVIVDGVKPYRKTTPIGQGVGGRRSTSLSLAWSLNGKGNSHRYS